MDNALEIVPFRARRYEAVPIAQIKVINSRNRDKEQFDMNVASIDHVGLIKPVRVNDKFLDRTGMYELICGEGRLLAHQRLGHETIQAEVVTCTRKEAYLQSLVENIARTKPDSMDFAREIKRLSDEGWTCEQLARITCKTEHYIREYIRLVEQGEERLIRGVEQGVFPIKFATQVASTDDGQLQNVLMDAFGEGLVTMRDNDHDAPVVHRHKAAIRRTELSLPVKCLLRDNLFATPSTFFDYGCGRGDDVTHLRRLGYVCDGWDPVYHSRVPFQAADIVNLGYVLNVIEDVQERSDTLVSAWDLCQKVLIVAARVSVVENAAGDRAFGDGVLTRIQTFQKFYTQTELREYIEHTLSQNAFPAAPGVFYVFRDEVLRERYFAGKYRRRSAAPKKRVAEQRFEKHRKILEPLIQRATELGRLPCDDEMCGVPPIKEVFGSLKQPFPLVRRVTGAEEWETLRHNRTNDLVVYLALARFRKRPSFSRLGPHDDGRLIGMPAVLGDQVSIPFALAEHGSAIGRVQQSALLGVDSRCSRIEEPHVGTLHERQALRIPPGGVAAIGPIPEPGDRIAAGGQRLDGEPVETFVDPFAERLLQGVHAVGTASRGFESLRRF